MRSNPDLLLTVINPSWPDGEDGFITALRDKNHSRVNHIEQKFGDDSASLPVSKGSSIKRVRHQYRYLKRDKLLKNNQMR